jgi:small subunit ribosomal protein S4
MAKYIGPKSKIARKFGEQIFGPDKVLNKKKYPPGQHGLSKKRGKQSEYAIQLLEKQKAKYTYGILERHFAILFEKAVKSRGITGEVLLQLCESRLDNIVYRLGISPTRSGARQLVGHKHILVNGKVLNIASAQLKPGDKIEVRERSKSLEAITAATNGTVNKYPWLTWDSVKMEGTYVSVPTRDIIPENIKEQMIVELYSK